MKEQRIKAIVKKACQKAEVIEIDNNLKSFQRIVGGLVERVPFPNMDGVDIYVNEEGKPIKIFLRVGSAQPSKRSLRTPRSAVSPWLPLLFESMKKTHLRMCLFLGIEKFEV